MGFSEEKLMTSKTDDAKYIRRGMLLACPEFLGDWQAELARMNRDKVGAPYEYPDSLLDFAARLKDYAGLSSRAVEGFLLGLSTYIPNMKRCDHTTICRRVNEFSKALKTLGGSTIAIDSSGLTPARKGGWLAFKHRKKQAYVKIHFAVDVRDGKILEFKVTPDTVGDNKVFPELVEKVRKRSRVRKALADGAYDDKKIDNAAKTGGYKLVVPPRKNSRVRRKPPPESAARNQRVREWKNLGKKRWKKKKGYGKRWAVETVYSTWKRLFGEGLSARGPKGVEAEVRRKVFLLNLFLAL
ncbi:TPA: IS5 family transposase [Candidatus Micrarchaeota archaeon]|nr:IS5 family transposase [Candidatus Micrarchaeota archaeon]